MRKKVFSQKLTRDLQRVRQQEGGCWNRHSHFIKWALWLLSQWEGCGTFPWYLPWNRSLRKHARGEWVGGSAFISCCLITHKLLQISYLSFLSLCSVDLFFLFFRGNVAVIAIGIHVTAIPLCVITQRITAYYKDLIHANKDALIGLPGDNKVEK